MGFCFKGVLLASAIALASPALIIRPAFAADVLTSNEKVKAMLNMIGDVFRTADPVAAAAVIDKRYNLPKVMSDHYNSMRGTLVNEGVEIGKNMDERKARTNEEGIPIWPQTAELMAMLEQMVRASFNLSFQAQLSAGYSPYIPILEGIAASVTPPPPPAEEDPAEGDPAEGDPEGDPVEEPPPFIPPVDGLLSGAAYFSGEAARIRQGANSLKAVTVQGAGSAEQLKSNLVSALSVVQTARGVHPFVDGAVDGLVNGLSKLVVYADGMTPRYDYFSQEMTDGIVAVANAHLQTSAAQELLNIAAYVDSIASSLNAIAAGIQSGDKAAAAGAAGAVNGLLFGVVERKAAAEAAVAGLAILVADLESRSRIYYFENLRDKHRHCFHEDKIAGHMQGYYSMVDEYNNLARPEEMIAQFNSGLWSSLREPIILEDTAQTVAASAKILALARAAGARFAGGTAGADPLPSVPQARYSGVCGEYVPNAAIGAVLLASDVQSDFRAVDSAALRVNREVKRRLKVTKTAACAPTNVKCIKKAVKAEKKRKQLESFKKNLVRRSKKLSKEVPVRLNEAYRELYGKYPFFPYR